MSRALVLTAYVKPSVKEMLQEMAAKTGKSHSEVIAMALKSLHDQMMQ